MKILKVKSCGSCPYIYASLVESTNPKTTYTYWCEFGKYIKKNGGTIRTNAVPKYLRTNLNKIPLWCPLEDYKETDHEKPA